MKDIPSELLSYIFTFLKYKELLSLRKVSKDFKNLITPYLLTSVVKDKNRFFTFTKCKGLLNIVKDQEEKNYVIKFAEKILSDHKSELVYMYSLMGTKGYTISQLDIEHFEANKKRAFDRINDQHSFWGQHKEENMSQEIEDTEKGIKRMRLE